MAGISGLQNTTAYRWWISYRFGLQANIDQGVSASHVEAKKELKLLLIKRSLAAIQKMGCLCHCPVRVQNGS